MLKSKILVTTAIFITAAVLFFTACGNKHIDNQTSTSSPSGSANLSYTAGTSTQTGISAQHSAETATTGSRTSESKTTKPANHTKEDNTITKKAEYLEFSYKNRLGQTVTYTENADNKYIKVASKQLKIPAEHLSATYYGNQAAIILFSQSSKNKNTVETFYLMDTKNMKVRVPNLNIATISEEQRNTIKETFKSTALAMYNNALENKPE